MNQKLNNMTDEQKDHFSPDRNHWCIVAYAGTTPMYYQGYFVDGKPAIGLDFNDALKCHSKLAADFILSKLRVSDWKVEDHRWM